MADEAPPEDPRDRAIRVMQTRIDLLVRAIRGEFSSMGRAFGGEEFDRLWIEADADLEPEAEV